MQAIEFNVPITENHEIHLKLPDDINATEYPAWSLRNAG
jgi:hypothetical protein